MHFDSLQYYVRTNIISELFRLVEKIKQFNFKLNSTNDPFILLYTVSQKTSPTFSTVS